MGGPGWPNVQQPNVLGSSPQAPGALPNLPSTPGPSEYTRIISGVALPAPSGPPALPAQPVAEPAAQPAPGAPARKKMSTLVLAGLIAVALLTIVLVLVIVLV
jgi:hypothetical protein